ncbi:hypothetical protein KUV80_15875 [Fictibacillus nanhaiensis]|uniref:hypothetical protein n=1 Tax=Fictibacillus nanhaiensis TaxID=742169 RepID=UPI001C94E542|nr:hypothetical protein [Fictibacillus nanhaiensis]MBY6038138.1 hypothetical protein [Fictibacillus nanhaiensis]
MSRGKSFEHKKQGHPGRFPNNTLQNRLVQKNDETDSTSLVTKEAFKNRTEDNE